MERIIQDSRYSGAVRTRYPKTNREAAGTRISNIVVMVRKI
jgi:hypothetical protein